jgi:hypothetical protein
VRDPEIDPIKSKIGLGVSKLDLGESEIGFILFFIPHWPRRIRDWPYAYFNSILAYHFVKHDLKGSVEVYRVENWTHYPGLPHRP